MRRVIAMAMACGAAACCLAWGPPGECDQAKSAECATACKATCTASETTVSAFERLKAMNGVWQTADENKDGAPDTTVIYRTVAGGTAVAEFLMPGTPTEMVTMYHIDGDTIMATHYCCLGNQPRMRASTGSDSSVLAFEFVDATNLAAPTDMHIHSLTLTFVDENQVKASWAGYQDGKKSEHSPTFVLSRVKDAESAAKIVNTSLTSSCATSSGCCSKGEAKTQTQ